MVTADSMDEKRGNTSFKMNDNEPAQRLGEVKGCHTISD